MKIDKNINILRYKNGLRSIILMLYVFSFSGYTGYIHTPQKTPVRTELVGKFNKLYKHNLKTYKQIVNGFYISRFQIFNLKYSAFLKNTLEHTRYKFYKNKYYTIILFNKIYSTLHKQLTYKNSPSLITWFKTGRHS